MEQEQNKKVRGLVLGGGGARGCYEVGAWQAFRECNIHFDCVSGTSIGAIVGAIYVQGNLHDAIEFVYTLKPSHIITNMPDLPENFDEIVANKETLFAFFKSYIKEGSDISPLKERIEHMFDYDAFMASKINYACMTYNITKMRGEAFFKKEMTRQDAIDIIIASASCYPAFPIAKIKDDLYIDGGFENNIPISLCQEMGANEFVVIDVHGPGRVKKIDANLQVKLIQPLLPLGNFLDFMPQQAKRSLHLGYLETMKYYSQFCGYLFTFTKESWPKIFMIEQYLKLKNQNHASIFVKGINEKAYQKVLGYKPSQLDSKYNTNDYFYGRLIECLAFIANLDPVMLYDYSQFLQELDHRLEALPHLEVPDSIKSIHDFMHNRKKEEIVNFFHLLLQNNNGKLPLTYEPLKNVFDVQYILALIWYELHIYLNEIS